MHSIQPLGSRSEVPGIRTARPGMLRSSLLPPWVARILNISALLGRVERGLFFERFDWVKEKKKKLGVDNLLKDWDKE